MAVATQRPPRPLRGSRLSSFYPTQSKAHPSLSSLDSAFQIQEYISLLIALNPHDVETIVSIPEKSRTSDGGQEVEEQASDEGGDVKADHAVDENCWIYEQLRRLAQDLTHPLITSLQQECTRTTCPEMKAGEWLYLCVAHGSDGAMEQCCAIDYILHTLDSATALLNSPRAFPSRLSIPTASIRHFSSLARRLGRIFAHAYFHHREAFEQAEAESSLYTRFLALTSKHNLVPAEFLVIPPRMGGGGPIASSSKDTLDREGSVEPPRLLAAGLEPLKGQDKNRTASAKYAPDSNIENSSTKDPAPPHFARTMSSENAPLVPDMPLSPRRVGRNRTDTMVYSDMAAYNEEMRGGGLGLDLSGGRGEKNKVESGVIETKQSGEDVKGGSSEPVEVDANWSTIVNPSEAGTSVVASDEQDEPKAEEIQPTQEPAPASVPAAEETSSAEADVGERRELELLASSDQVCAPDLPAPASDETTTDAKLEATADTPETSSSTDIADEEAEVTLEESSLAELTEADPESESEESETGPGGFVLLSSSDDSICVAEDVSALGDVQGQGLPVPAAEVFDEKKGVDEPTATDEHEHEEQKVEEAPQSGHESVEKDTVKLVDAPMPSASEPAVESSSTEPLVPAEGEPESRAEEAVPTPATIDDESVGDKSEEIVDPNRTLEEDLQDVEEALKD